MHHPQPAPRFAMPPALIILSVVVIVAGLAAVLLPAGGYERVEQRFPNLVAYTVADGDTLQSINQRTGSDATQISDFRLGSAPDTPIQSLTAGQDILVPKGGLTRSAVIPGTYTPLGPDQRAGLPARVVDTASDVALAPIVGFIDKAQIIGFVLLLGGAFGVIIATGAIDTGLRWAVLRVGSGPARWLVIPVCFTLFSLGGAVFGMGESTIAFVLITVPLALRLGYDTLTGVAICYMASQVGFAGAFFNPFTVGIAQGIAELPYLSGLTFRLVVWVTVTSIGIAFTMYWAQRVSKNPACSPTFALDEAHREQLADQDRHPMAKLRLTEILIVALAFSSVFVSAYGVAELGWYINEMAALFVVTAILCAALARFKPKRLSDEFVKGAAMMAEPALIISCSAGIVIVLQEGQVLDTILYRLATPLESLGPTLGAGSLMLVQAGLNFFVPSGSGQAAMTMPIVTPLCDLIGLNRQVGVLAFQFGDGFGNMVIPTSAVLMGVLGVAKIPWTIWLRWVLPLVVVLHLVGVCFLTLAASGPDTWMQ